MVGLAILLFLILMWGSLGGIAIHSVLTDIRDELRKQNEKE